MSAPAEPLPIVIAAPSSLVTSPPSEVVPSWLWPVDAVNELTMSLNSLLKSAASITSPVAISVVLRLT